MSPTGVGVVLLLAGAGGGLVLLLAEGYYGVACGIVGALGLFLIQADH